MDLTEGSETSAKLNLTPGKYPKENIQDSEHVENFKSRIYVTSLLAAQSLIVWSLRMLCMIGPAGQALTVTVLTL
jgi:hypothetical protein